MPLGNLQYGITSEENKSGKLFEIIRYAPRGWCAHQVDYGMVHCESCSEVNTLNVYDRERKK